MRRPIPSRSATGDSMCWARWAKGTDPGPDDAMRGQYPELADDVVDFAIGDVWAKMA